MLHNISNFNINFFDSLSIKKRGNMLHQEQRDRVRKTFFEVFGECIYNDIMREDKNIWIFTHVRDDIPYIRDLFDHKKNEKEEIQKDREEALIAVNKMNSAVAKNLKISNGSCEESLPLISSALKSLYPYCKKDFLNCLLYFFFENDTYGRYYGGSFKSLDKEQQIAITAITLHKSLPYTIVKELDKCSFDTKYMEEKDFFYLFSLLVNILPCFLFIFGDPKNESEDIMGRLHIDIKDPHILPKETIRCHIWMDWGKTFCR